MDEVTQENQQTAGQALKIEKSDKMAEVAIPNQQFLEEPATPEPYQDSEYGDDPWDPEEPEFLWNKYLKGVKFHEVPSVPNRVAAKKSKANASRRTHEASETKMAAASAPADVITTNDQRGADSSREESVASTAAPPQQGDGNFRSISPEAAYQNLHHHHPGGKKKPSMRTSRDVIHRITWDPDLPAENFTVGYLDRFVGLVEKPFLFFDWTEDISAVDYDVLAVPQHRICYFKYREQKVWDKNERLDLIFGSTETSKEEDIRDLITRLDEEHSRLPVEEQYGGVDYDSDDDGVRVCIDRVNDVRLTELARRIPPARPNYFVAIRVTDPLIQQRVCQVKRHLLAKEPRMHDFLMPDGALHVTLAMLKLDGPEEIDEAVRALERCRQALAHYFCRGTEGPLEVKLDGLDTFNSYVLYAKVQAPTAFYDMHRDLLRLLGDEGVQLAHEYDFVPHMTLLKLTRSRARLLRCPYIDPFVYVEHKATTFGAQRCDNLHLCVIGEEKRYDGFYQSAAEIHFEEI